MAQTEILYIDCNRQNSVRSEERNNIWEYKIGDEGMVLPAGSQISIQDTFINKKGISNQSITFEETITERVSFGFYINYDAHWMPKGEAQSDPAIENYEGLYENVLTELTTGACKVKFARNNDKTGLLVNPDTSVRGRTVTYLQPSIYGFPNTALPVVESLGQEQVLVGNWTTAELRPTTRNVDITIPKGTYGLTEIAQLITDQMNGTLTNVANNDMSQDYIRRRAMEVDNNLTINSNNTTVIEKLPLHDGGLGAAGNKSNPYSSTSSSNTNGVTANNTPIAQFYGSIDQGAPIRLLEPQETTTAIFFTAGQAAGGGEPASARFKGDPALILAANGLIFLNGEYIQYGAYAGVVQSAGLGFGGANIQLLRFNNCTRGMYQGSDATKYSALVRDTDYQGVGPRLAPFRHQAFDDNNQEMGVLAVNNNFQRRDATWEAPSVDRLLACTPEGYNKMIESMKSPTANNRGDPLKDIRKVSVQLRGNQNTAFTPLTNGFNHSSQWLQTDYCGLWYFRDYSQLFGQSGINFNYNPMRRGIYVGAPKLKIDWSSATSSFTIDYLHMPHHISSHDNYGNANEAEGTEALYVKRLTSQASVGQPNPGQPNYNPNFIHPDMRRGMENPVERTTGISVYNWAVNSARRYSDVNWQDGTVFNQDYTNILTWDDYFTTKEIAEEAWKKTLWGKLGFSYDQLANSDNWDRGLKRYDVRIGEDFSVGGKDYRMYGTSTRSSYGVDANSTISTTYNPNEKAYFQQGAQPIRAYNQMDVNTSYLGYTTSTDIPKTAQGDNSGGNMPGAVDTAKSFFSSMYQQATAAYVATTGRSIRGQFLPTLNDNGYYVITSDVIDTHEDSIKNNQNLPLLGLVPLATITAQDFITSQNQMIHIVGQEKVINSIVIKILNPDLTNANLEPNSSVVLKIIRPVPNPVTKPAREQDNKKPST